MNQKREPFTEFMYGSVADMKRPNMYATMKRGDEIRRHGPMTATEWGRLVDQERLEGWELMPDNPAIK